MKKYTAALFLMMLITSSLVAQKKGEMAFTSTSRNANEMLRNAWAALADVNFESANKYSHAVLSEDPACGMAYASLFSSNREEREANLSKAAATNLSPDEKMFIEGLMARMQNKSNEPYFEPLLKKYPADYYLNLWIMYQNTNKERAMQIGESILKRNRKAAPVYNLLGYLYMDKNEMEKAETYFDKYLSLRPDLANPYDSKGDFFMRTGNFEEAIALYEKAAGMGMKESAEKAERARARLKFPELSFETAGQIKEIVANAFSAFKERNAEAFLKDQSEHAIEIFPDQRVNVGRANIRQRVSENFRNAAVLTSDYKIEQIKGVGPIGIAYGKRESVVKDNASGTETTQKYGMVFLFRSDQDRSWKFLASHLYGLNEDSQPLSADDRTMIQKLLSDWDNAFKRGEILTDKNFQTASNLYSPQAVEIFPTLISNVGLLNLQARWQNFIGVKMEANSLGPLGVEGLGRRAVAWGIGKQAFYLKTGELQQFDFPWAMILTRDKDDAWKILAMHWGAN